MGDGKREGMSGGDNIVTRGMLLRWQRSLIATTASWAKAAVISHLGTRKLLLWEPNGLMLAAPRQEVLPALNLSYCRANCWHKHVVW